LFLFLIFSIAESSVFGQELDLEARLSALKLEKNEALVMITNMERSGRLDSEQAQKARKEIVNVYTENLDKLKSEALEKIENHRSLSSSSN